MLPFLALVSYYFIGTSLYYYYIFYAIAGIGNAGVLMLAYIADISKTDDRSVFIGKLESVYAIVSIFSPLLKLVFSNVFNFISLCIIF